MTPIPSEKTRKAAALLWGDLVGVYDPVKLLAEAIEAERRDERERCAKIAMSRRSTPSRDMDQYGTTLAIDIASAIRQDNPNET